LNVKQARQFAARVNQLSQELGSTGGAAAPDADVAEQTGELGGVALAVEAS